MPLFNDQRHSKRGTQRAAIAVTLVAQIVVLLALSVAAVRYLEWSSEVNQAEFISVTTSSVSGPNHLKGLSTPIQPVNGEAACARKARWAVP